MRTTNLITVVGFCWVTIEMSEWVYWYKWLTFVVCVSFCQLVLVGFQPWPVRSLLKMIKMERLWSGRCTTTTAATPQDIKRIVFTNGWSYCCCPHCLLPAPIVSVLSQQKLKGQSLNLLRPFFPRYLCVFNPNHRHNQQYNEVSMVPAEWLAAWWFSHKFKTVPLREHYF